MGGCLSGLKVQIQCQQIEDSIEAEELGVSLSSKGRHLVTNHSSKFPRKENDSPFTASSQWCHQRRRWRTIIPAYLTCWRHLLNWHRTSSPVLALFTHSQSSTKVTTWGTSDTHNKMTPFKLWTGSVCEPLWSMNSNRKGREIGTPLQFVEIFSLRKTWGM